MVQQRHSEYPTIAGLIPASASFRRGEEYKLPLEPIAGRPLVDYAVRALTECKHIQTTYVSTNDAEIEKVAVASGADSLGCRPKDLSHSMASVVHVVKDFLLRLSHNRMEVPELIVTLTPNYPLIFCAYIEEAIDTLLLHDYESVISVVDDKARHWRPGEMGLTPAGDGHELIRHDKDSVYEETGGIRVVRTRNLLGQEWLGHSVGYVELSPSDAIAADGDEALTVLLEQMLETRVSKV
jgi:CMP-N-acetylneuraminic acid synthetase